ncbi:MULTISPECIES: cytochrome c [Burkholderia cepacia complex]|uniref:cytochrome c n=1 Tax=Burkholderia cepacia complex TaxID=87882 RepID=UPI00196BA9A3|nr:cytochrome c [Burkholderia cenocepacia]MBN3567177.1 cytochrome c [Burkholderia cenocepacia]MBR8110639.1 cytochrome c [Burkholderia cenocepacia]
MKILLLASLGISLFSQTSQALADSENGKKIFLARCAMCHGADARGTGPLANKSSPPTPDLTTPAFKKRLSDYPGVIVSSVILRPNGDLIPKTLRENGIKLPPHPWTVKDFRDLNQYMTGLISKK